MQRVLRCMAVRFCRTGREAGAAGGVAARALTSHGANLADLGLLALQAAHDCLAGKARALDSKADAARLLHQDLRQRSSNLCHPSLEALYPQLVLSKLELKTTRRPT